MSTTLAPVDGPADAELISAVRGGDVDAYGELFSRHVDAARRLARQLTTPADADDLVSDAFAKVLAVLQRGGGPDIAFRAYLLTAVRRLHVDRLRAGSKVRPTDDLEPFDPGVPFVDTAVAGFENAAAARAFASLPERWQLVLWHTEVEGQKPAEVAPLLGMTPNSVAALAYRAREGLRQAFLAMHVAEIDEDACRWTRGQVGAYVRGGLSRRDGGKVEAHLETCRPCTAIYLELTEVNSNLSAVLAPALLGAAALAYVGAGAAGGTLLAKGGLIFLAGRVRDVLIANATSSAAAGVAATVVVTGGTVAAVQVVNPDLGRAPAIVADPSPTVAPGTTGAAPGGDPSGTGGPGTAPTSEDASPGAASGSAAGSPTASDSPSEAPTDPTDPTTAPTDDAGLPTESPSPSDTPSETPTDGPTDGSPSPVEGTDPATPEPPSQSEAPPPALDLGVTLTAAKVSGSLARWHVVVTATDLSADGTATIRITSTTPALGAKLPAGCTSTDSRTATCTATPEVATFAFDASFLRNSELTAEVTPGPATDDTDPSTNTARASITGPLGSLLR